MAYDKDVSPAMRKQSPDLYGFVPNAGRGLAFVTMLTLSILHVVAKTLATALLVVTNPSWLLYYLICDMGFYFLQKTLRRDIIYWFPLPLAVSIPVSVLVRVMGKIVTDFTGCLLFKHPNELGGAYFSFNLMTTQISVPVIVYLYHKHYVGNDKMDENMTWLIVVTLLVLWLMTFSFSIIKVVVPKYRKTFFSFQAGWQKSQSFFLDNEGNDERRLCIFNDNAYNWRSIDSEVRQWTGLNWQRWEEEKPAWFTPFRIASIPDDYIPVDARARRGSASLNANEAVDLQRRRSRGGGELRVEEGVVD
jgi:hypothetical protein